MCVRVRVNEGCRMLTAFPRQNTSLAALIQEARGAPTLQSEPHSLTLTHSDPPQAFWRPRAVRRRRRRRRRRPTQSPQNALA